MITSRLFKAFQQRGIQPAYAAATQTPFFNQPMRFFSKEETEAEEPAAAEAAEEPVPEPVPEPVKAAPKAAPVKAVDLGLDKSLFQPWSVGNINKVESTADHKPPSEEDTIEGRYSSVLFTTASMNGDLYNVYEDMNYLQQVYKHSDMFRLFTENQGVGSQEVAKFN